MMSLLDSGSASRFHVSGSVLTRMATDELSLFLKLLAQRHLNRCSKCRAEHRRIVRTALDIVEYRQAALKRIGPLPSAKRELFIRRLDAELWSARRPWWRRLLPRPEILAYATSPPALISALILIVAGLVTVSVLRWPVPTVSAAEFMDRAVVSDRRPAQLPRSGVICRRLLIKTGQKTLEHPIYRDLSGHRQRKYARVGREEADLAARLALAGVNWDDPLSAASFKSWHDRQVHPVDKVQSSGDGLLTMSTRLPSTDILQESLTVAGDSFHPVQRTVEYRAIGKIEVSEISVAVLSADKANQLFFELQPENSSAIRSIPAGPLLPTDAQLNETELLARLTLNRLSADTGEQIEITRDAKQVRVNGVVETEERKQQLSQSLQAMPFLAVTIHSFDDLRSVSAPRSPAPPAHQQSTLAHISPLEEYFVDHGRSRDDLGRISAGLFNCSLSISRSSRSIEQIALRFSSADDLTSAAIRARDELLSRSVEMLINDLKEQEGLLRETGITFESTPLPTQTGADQLNLKDLAGRNTAATKWLISGTAESGRSEFLKAKAAELAQTISELRSAAFAYVGSHAKP